MNNLKQLLLEAPEEQLDRSMITLIEQWDEPPRAIQILEVVDMCIYYGLSSDFVVASLQVMLDAAMINEQTTLEQLEQRAVWRF
jgi:hypothetical protein